MRLISVARGGVTELRVSDEGAGFPAEFLPRAFERFARADDARSGGSAGLGLSIVQAIVRAHGGTAVAVNGAERGAVVALTIPAETGAPVGAPSPP